MDGRTGGGGGGGGNRRAGRAGAGALETLKLSRRSPRERIHPARRVQRAATSVRGATRERRSRHRGTGRCEEPRGGAGREPRKPIVSGRIPPAPRRRGAVRPRPRRGAGVPRSITSARG
eukprot:30711-Pelagococcus_subviridis.AAC.4